MVVSSDVEDQKVTVPGQEIFDQRYPDIQATFPSTVLFIKNPVLADIVPLILMPGSV